MSRGVRLGRAASGVLRGPPDGTEGDRSAFGETAAASSAAKAVPNRAETVATSAVAPYTVPPEPCSVTDVPKTSWNTGSMTTGKSRDWTTMPGSRNQARSRPQICPVATSKPTPRRACTRP